jgi:ribonuclease J
VIDTPKGRIVHTGDFKLDAKPLVGEPWDPELWGAIGAEGVKVLTCDSTNVFSLHPGRSESEVGPEIRKLVESAKGMVVATTFASNVARVRTLAEAARDAGRSVCLLGRAMRRMVEASVVTNVLTNFPTTVSVEEAENIPRENLMLIVTGSQGERRAASAALSRGKYRGLEVAEGDLFLFSSKTIPGNEKGVNRIINAFSEKGVDIVDDSSGFYHVSGHANRPDLDTVHKLLKPKMVIPMHGEHRHLREHSKLAAENGAASIVAPNGTMVDLTGDVPKVAEYIEAGRTYLDGKMQIGAMDGVVRNRLRIAMNGHVLVTLIMEDTDPLGDPWVEISGLSETGSSNAALAEVMEEDLSQFIGRAKKKTMADDDKLEDELRQIVRRTAQDEIGKKPEVTVVISRLSA